MKGTMETMTVATTAAMSKSEDNGERRDEKGESAFYKEKKENKRDNLRQNKERYNYNQLKN